MYFIRTINNVYCSTVGPHRSQGEIITQPGASKRSEEHTSELQSCNLVCRLLLEKKNNLVRAHSQVRGTLNPHSPLLRPYYHIQPARQCPCPNQLQLSVSHARLLATTPA